jgi:hypothetical protein
VDAVLENNEWNVVVDSRDNFKPTPVTPEVAKPPSEAVGQTKAITDSRRRKLLKEATSQIQQTGAWATHQAAREGRQGLSKVGITVHKKDLGEVISVIGERPAKGRKTGPEAGLWRRIRVTQDNNKVTWDGVAAEQGYETLEDLLTAMKEDFVETKGRATIPDNVVDQLAISDNWQDIAIAAKYEMLRDGGYSEADIADEVLRIKVDAESDLLDTIDEVADDTEIGHISQVSEAVEKELAEERAAIQAEGEATEVGDFLEGIEDKPRARPGVTINKTLTGETVEDVAGTGTQSEMFDKKDFTTFEEQDRINAKEDLPGQATFLKPTPKEKRIISKESYEKAKKRLLDKGTFRVGLGPQELVDAVTIGAFHIENGLRTFGAWSKQMIADFGPKIKPQLAAIWEKANASIGKELAPSKILDMKAFTPDIVAKELPGKVPAVTMATQDAPALMDAYWREFDEREFEINVQTRKNQEAIAKALGQTSYSPKSDKATGDTSLAMMLNIDLKEHPEGHDFAKKFTGKQKALYEQSQNLDPKLQQIADKIIEQNREAGELAVEMDVITAARENYIAHLWERSPQRERFFAKFRQQTARSKRRKLPGGIAEGWSRGMKLRVEDVTLASQIAQVQVAQAAVGKKLLQAGKDWGLLSHEQETEEWVQAEHPGFTTWRFRGTLGLGDEGPVAKDDWVRAEDRDNLGKVLSIAGDTATVKFTNKKKGTTAEIELPVDSLKRVRPRGKNFFITEEGVVMERVPVYAEPELGKTLNNVFSPSVLYKIPGVETVTKYNAVIKSTILYTSLFHHQAFLRSYSFGSEGLNPVQAYQKGREAIEHMTPEVRMLVRNGLTLGRIQDYDPRMLEGKDTIWGKVFSLTDPTEKVNEWLQNMRRKQERFLFNKLGPYLKTQAAILELKTGLERNRTAIENGTMTEEEVAAQVANLINNDFGGLHLGRMGRNNTVQHLMRLLLLAPDWTESNVRSMVDAFRKGETGYMHRKFWGRIAAKGLGATVLFNLLLSGFDDDDFVERYRKAWREGRLRWLDVDITPIYEAMGGKSGQDKYFSLIGHFRDPVKFVTAPGRSLKHKGSVVSKTLFDFATGQDWAGRKFTTVGELTGISEGGDLAGRLVKWDRGKAEVLKPEQLPSWFTYEARSAMPIPMQNIISFMAGEMDAFDAVTKSLGLMASTTYGKKEKGRVTIPD